ncbi:hypothetical protein BDV93DRAFT_545252 [Ceratobasidium sp. AG-I]|nr:hypothetical protein BDV93DRAFT_545252 [Ceratobasidium sp. AG-I]
MEPPTTRTTSLYPASKPSLTSINRLEPEYLGDHCAQSILDASDEGVAYYPKGATPVPTPRRIAATSQPSKLSFTWIHIQGRNPINAHFRRVDIGLASCRICDATRTRNHTLRNQQLAGEAGVAEDEWQGLGNESTNESVSAAESNAGGGPRMRMVGGRMGVKRSPLLARMHPYAHTHPQGRESPSDEQGVYRPIDVPIPGSYT